MAFELQKKSVSASCRTRAPQVAFSKRGIVFNNSARDCILSGEDGLHIFVDDERHLIGFRPTAKTATDAYSVIIGKNGGTRISFRIAQADPAFHSALTFDKESDMWIASTIRPDADSTR